MSEGMPMVVVHHAEVAQQFTELWVAASSAMEFVLKRSPTEAFRVDVVDQLVSEFRKQEERCSCLEKSGVRVLYLILGLPSSWLTDQRRSSGSYEQSR
jgi:hypothetical protein